MIKVFLVEDEFVVRQGIKKNIDWSGHGYEFCGEASDGELAFPMIQKLKPDIVITDIKMPFMDGLTLSKLIRKELPRTEIIILSGYEEFSYAREAIRLGIANYLSKPISGQELLREVDNVAEKIRESRMEQEIADRYRREMEENVNLERKAFFETLVTGEGSASELIEKAGQLDMDITAMCYNILLVKLQSENMSGGASNEEVRNSAEILEKVAAQSEFADHILIFNRNLEGKALLLKADSVEELEQIQNSFIDTFVAEVKKKGGLRYYVGVGTSSNRLRELKTSFEKASKAFAHRYFAEESSVIRSEENPVGYFRKGEDINLSNVDSTMLDKNRIKEFLRVGDLEEIVYFIDEFAEKLGRDAMRSNIFRLYVAMNANFAVTEFMEEIQMPRELVEPLNLESGVTDTMDSVLNYVSRILTVGIEQRNRVASNRYGALVEEVIRYIEENYADEELSLNTLADHVKFSPNHLSMVFSQETGQTFIKFLTDYRMNKAKELLRCTGMKSSAIALEVGYKDPHYFSFLFKKTQGVTPTQYRSGKRGEA